MDIQHKIKNQYVNFFFFLPFQWNVPRQSFQQDTSLLITNNLGIDFAHEQTFVQNATTK